MAKRTDNDNNEQNNPQQEEPKAASSVLSTTKASPIITAAARLPGANLLGSTWYEDIVADIGAKAKPLTTPGAMILQWIPSLGLSAENQSSDPVVGVVNDKFSSPVTRAANLQFADLRSHISGNRPYETADWIIYNVCVQSMRSFYFYLARLYGLQQTYASTNEYWPSAILSGMGYDPDEVRNNSPTLYFLLARIREALKPFPTVPFGNMSMDHESMNRYIFCDLDSPRSQAYVFQQMGFWSYEGVDKVKGCSVRLAPTTIDECVELWDEMYSALMGSSDVNIIAADVMRAYGKSDVSTGEGMLAELPLVAANYVVEFSKNDTLLAAINNATIVPAVAPNYLNPNANMDERANARDNTLANLQTFRIEDGGNNTIVTKTYFDIDGLDARLWLAAYHSFAYCPKHLNSYEAVPAPETIVDITRFHTRFLVETRPGADLPQTVYPRIWLQACGTEVIVGARVVIAPSIASARTSWCYTFQSNHNLVIPNHGNVFCFCNAIANTTSGMQILNAVSAFDWHPVLGTMVLNGQIPTVSQLYYDAQLKLHVFNNFKDGIYVDKTLIRPFGSADTFLGYNADVYHTIPASAETIARIHEARLLQQFGFGG